MNTAPPDYGLDRLQVIGSHIQIRTRDEYQRAGEILVEIASAMKKLLEGDETSGWLGWNRIVKATRTTYDDMLEARRNHMRKWNDLRDAYDKAMAKFREDEEGRHQKIQEGLRETSEGLRQKLTAEARRMLRAGKPDQAQNLIEQRDLLPENPTVEPLDLRLPGINQIEDIEIEVTDLLALVKAVANGAVPLTGIVQRKEFPIFEVRESVLVALARSMGEAAHFPGVKITRKTTHRPRATV